MNFTEEQKELIKTHFKDYLEENGIKTRGLINCINPQHDDSTASMSYDPKTNLLHCFGCNCNYDIFSLYALNKGLDNNADFRRIAEELAIKYNIDFKTNTTKPYKKTEKVEAEKPDFSKYYKKVAQNIDKTDYLQKRGITDAIIKKYNIGYDITEKEVILPVSKYFYVGRYTDERQGFKHHKPKGATQELFNLDYLKASDYKSVIWLTESIIDALSLEVVKEDIKAISLNGVAYAKEFIKELKQNNFKGAVILALDTDATGIKTSRDIKEDLEDLGIKTLIFNSNSDRYGEGIKDINEMLINDAEKLKSSVIYFDDSLRELKQKEALALLEKENTLNYLDTFSTSIKDTINNKPLSTGISRLDKVLDGGFYKKNLVIIGAISSLGKTTLALQIADNVARQGEDVLIFSLEMSKEELIAKSISRGMFIKAEETHQATYKTLSTREILKGVIYDEDLVNKEDINALYDLSFNDYKDNVAKHIFITECNENNTITTKTIESRIKRQIEITNKKPLVIIDYLQIIQNTEKGLTDKQAVDRLVVDLKRIARDNDITIILISAFNRGSYNVESNLASFRDTSTIEYTADVLIALQVEELDGKTDDNKNKVNVNILQQKDVRALMLKVLKNRNGRIADVKHIDFYAKNNYMKFKEYDENYVAYKD